MTRPDKCFKGFSLAAILRIDSSRGKDGSWGTSQEGTVKIRVRDNDGLEQVVAEVRLETF